MHSSKAFLASALVLVWFAAVIVLSPLPPRVAVAEPETDSSASSRAAPQSQPLYLIENLGQLPEPTAYVVEGRDKTVLFDSQGLTYVIGPCVGNASATPQAAAWPSSAPARPTADRWAVRLDFLNANPQVRPIGRKRAEAVFSYFAGPRENWATGASAYAEIVYQDLWPGIDLVYAASASRLKYTFVVGPGADPGRIRLAYEGADVGIDHAGRLRVATPTGTFHDEKPVAQQSVAGRDLDIPVSYELLATEPGRTIYSFRIGEHDPSAPLLIDPSVFIYSGYITPAESADRVAIALDREGNAYIAGGTSALGFLPPLVPGPVGDAGTTDAFVAKVSADGSTLLALSRLGGSMNDRAQDISLDADGNVYITGTTESSNFPVAVGPDLSYNGGFRDAFVAKLNSDLTALTYAGFVGGSEVDDGIAIAVDAQHAAYITGETRSPEASFPVLLGPDLTHKGGADAFVVKVKPDGTALTYAGYIGGGSREFGLDVAVDVQGAAYIVGQTFSTDGSFPQIVGPDLTFNGGPDDAFVSKVSPDGSRLEYSGYIGGASSDTAHAVRVDSLGRAYVAGSTFSTEETFPVAVGPNLVLTAADDAFVARVAADGSALDFAGYIGGFGSDVATGIALDHAGDIYLTGFTRSGETGPPGQVGFPVAVGPDLTFNGGAEDAFLAKLHRDGSGLIQAGYIGGFEADRGWDLAVDGDGNAYVAGLTFSREVDGFPLLIGPDLTFNETLPPGANAFVSKISTETPMRDVEVTENGVTNAASGVQFPDPLHPTTPGSIVSIFGRFAWESANAAAVPLPTELAGVLVTFNGMPASLFAVIRGEDFGLPFDQINAQMPWGVDTASGLVTVVVTHDGESSLPREVQVAPVSPGIFTFEFGTGPAIVQNFKFQDDDVVDGSFALAPDSIPGVETQAAPVGGAVVIFANGLGEVDGPIADGEAGLRQVTGEVKVFIGGVEAQIIGAVLHATLVALNQVNAFVPDIQPGDQVPIQIEVNGVRSRPDIFIAVRAATL